MSTARQLDKLGHLGAQAGGAGSLWALTVEGAGITTLGGEFVTAAERVKHAAERGKHLPS